MHKLCPKVAKKAELLQRQHAHVLLSEKNYFSNWSVQGLVELREEDKPESPAALRPKRAFHKVLHELKFLNSNPDKAMLGSMVSWSSCHASRRKITETKKD